MAEVTAMRHNALPYPVYGLPWTLVVPLLDADGDPISPSSPDSEVSKNGDTFADCTNEMTELATSSGVVYLTLTGTEMTADVVAVQLKSTGAKTTIAVLYPRKLVSIRAGTAADDGSGTSTIVLDASASAVDDFYNGMIVAAVIDGTTEVRMITDYTGSTQTAAVTPDFITAVDNNDTFTIYRPDGVQMQQANVSHWNGLATVELPLVPTTAGRKLDVSVGGEAGVDWANVGSPTTTLNLSGTTVKTATDVETDTQDIQGRLPAALVSGRIDSSVGAMAANVMTAAAAAADLTTELQSGLATAAALDAVDDYIDTEIAAIKAKTDNLPASPAAVGSAMTLTAAYDFAKGTAAMTEAYAANGVAPTPIQALYAIQQMLQMFAISGTSLTVKKLDNSTTAFIVTLDSATAPTSAART